MKIGFVLDDSLDKTDGVQQYVLTIGRWMSENGHDVHYLVGESSRVDLPNLHSLSRNVSVRFNHNRMSTPLPASRGRIKRLLKREKFDVLHIQMPYSPFLAGRVINAAPPACTVVGTFHIMAANRLSELANRAVRLSVARSLRRFDKIFSVSEPTVEFAKQIYGISSDVLPCAIKLDAFYNAKPIKKYQDSTINIVFLGRLVERKGCHYLLAAVKRLLEIDSTKIRVIICGPGPEEKRLKEFVKTNHLEQIVQFIGQVNEEKADYLASAHLAVFPSTKGETFGIVLAEAMASGSKVVIGGDNPGYRAVLGGREDHLIDPTDTESFAKLLKHYITNPSARQKARIWQAQYVKQFDVGVVGQNLIGYYQELVEKKHTR